MFGDYGETDLCELYFFTSFSQLGRLTKDTERRVHTTVQTTQFYSFKIFVFPGVNQRFTLFSLRAHDNVKRQFLENVNKFIYS